MKRKWLHKFKMMIFICRVKNVINRRINKGETRVKFEAINNLYWIYVSLKILKKRKVFNIEFTHNKDDIFEPDCIVTKTNKNVEI